MKQVSRKNATITEDWKGPGGINAGQDFYRVFESEKAGETIITNGKEERTVLNELRGNNNRNKHH